MDKKIMRRDYLEIIDRIIELIKANKRKILKYFEDFYDDTTDELNCKLKEYEKSGLLGIKYYNLLDSIGKFVNKYDIDYNTIKESIINKINDHCRLNVLNKACFSEPEDEINDDNEDERSDDNENEINDDDNNNNNNEKNIENNEENHKTKEIIIDNKNIASDIIDDLRIVLKKAIISNNEELMNNTIKLMNTLLITNQENNINTVTNQENSINTATNQENSINKVTKKENNINKVTTYFKTPEWIINRLNTPLQLLKLVEKTDLD